MVMDVSMANANVHRVINIHQIPTRFAIPFDNENELMMTGIVHYDCYSIDEVGKSEGHYVSLTYRPGNAAWYETDGMTCKVTRCKSAKQVVPALIFLVKRKK